MSFTIASGSRLESHREMDLSGSAWGVGSVSSTAERHAADTRLRRVASIRELGIEHQLVAHIPANSDVSCRCGRISGTHDVLGLAKGSSRDCSGAAAPRWRRRRPRVSGRPGSSAPLPSRASLCVRLEEIAQHAVTRQLRSSESSIFGEGFLCRCLLQQISGCSCSSHFSRSQCYDQLSTQRHETWNSIQTCLPAVRL